MKSNQYFESDDEVTHDEMESAGVTALFLFALPIILILVVVLIVVTI
jgi:hypothetical protein